MNDIVTGEVKERRRTVVVYKSAASEGPTDGQREKLSSYKNLMYSTREAELIEDACRFLIEKCPVAIKQLFALIDKANHDDLAECLIALSYGTGSVFALLHYFIGDEFETNNTAGQLMRENCIASKLIKSYLKKFGQDYLKETLVKFITSIVVHERKANYEINPGKVDQDEIDKNRELLEKKLDYIIKHLTSKEVIEKMPAGIRIIAKFIAEFARSTNNDVHILVGSFIFLRYINPSIFSPEAFGLLPPSKIPGVQTRRNLTLITKVLQILANGKLFSNKEQYMVTLNPFVERNLQVVRNYFDEIVNFTAQPQTIHSVEVNELSVYDLQVFHSLIFQHKEVILDLFEQESQSAEFQKLLDKLGSYETKVSFSFLPESEQKYVKQILSSRNDEASFIGYVEMVSPKSKSKTKIEKSILIVGIYRIIWCSLSGKVIKEAHLHDLKGITSNDTKSFTLIFKDFEIVHTAEDADIIIESVRRAFEFTFHSMPADLKPQLNITPDSRVQSIPISIDEPCLGLVSTYKSMCDYYDVKANQEVCWDLENLYQNSVTFNLKKFTSLYLDPLKDKDTLPLFHSLAYNTYFTTVIIKHFKFSSTTFHGIVEMITHSPTIEDLCLSDVQVTDKQYEAWTSFFEGMSKNENLALKSLDLSNSSIEDRCMNPLGAFLKKYKKPILKIDLTNTCGEKAGKGSGLLSVFDGLSQNKIINSKLAVLKVSRNKLTSLESPLTRVIASCPQLLELELASSNIDLNIIAQMGLINQCPNLHLLNISGNKLSKPEMWTNMLKYVETPSCNLGELNISNTSIPPQVLRDLLLKLNPDCSIMINASHNNIGLSGAQLLGPVLSQINNVNSLDLSDNNIGDEGLSIILEGLFNNQSLTCLNISRNFSKESGKARDKMIQTLIQLINKTSCPLESLHLAGGPNSRLKEKIVPFISALGFNKRISEIDISGHSFGDKGAISLAKTLEINHVITSIQWDDNNTGITGLANIKDSIQANQNLKTMPLPWHDIVKVMNQESVDKNSLPTLLEKITQQLMNNQLVI